MVAALAALMLLAGTPGSAGRWWWLFTEKDAAWFVDAPSIVTDGDIREYWREIVFRTPKGSVAYEMIREAVGCRSHRITALRVIQYSTGGEILADQDYRAVGGRASDIVPDSTGESVMLFVCADPSRREDAGALPVYRQPERVTHDIYILLTFGLTDYQAALMASIDAKRQPEFVEKAIESLVKPEYQARVRSLYGFPPLEKPKT